MKTFFRQGRTMPYNIALVKKLYEACKKYNAVKMLFAEDKDEHIVAAGFFVSDERNVYYLMGGIEPKYKELGGMDLILYEGIKAAMRENKVFDFEGSVVESIERYFRSFGSEQKPYFVVTKTPSRFLKLKQFVKELV
jgi:hypothetical protein